MNLIVLGIINTVKYFKYRKMKNGGYSKCHWGQE